MARRLPPITALRAFEVAARRESFKLAAEELGVTATAVSHQVKNLERHLDQALFLRRTRQVTLTEPGRLLFVSLSDAFDRIEETVQRLDPKAARSTVTLSLGPIVAAKWLSPRLSRFWLHHPDVDLRLHHSPLTVDFRAGDMDMAVAWGEGHWPGLTVERLLDIRVTPVLSPELLKQRGKPRSASDLYDLPLLHQRDNRGWQEWFSVAGIENPEARQGMVIEDAHVVLQAAIEGQGVALGVIPFIDDDFAAGRLVQPFGLTVSPKRAYYLVYPRGALRQTAHRQLRDWLLSEATAAESL